MINFRKDWQISDDKYSFGLVGRDSVHSHAFQQVLLLVFENCPNDCFAPVLHFINLVVVHRLVYYLFPNLVNWQSFQVPNNNAVVFGSGQTDIDSPHVAHKTDCLLLVHVHLLTIKSRSHCTQNNHIFFSALERIYRLNFQRFWAYCSMNAVNLLTVRRNYTNVLAVFLQVLCQLMDKFRLIYIHIWTVLAFFITSFQVEHHKRRRNFSFVCSFFRSISIDKLITIKVFSNHMADLWMHSVLDLEDVDWVITFHHPFE